MPACEIGWETLHLSVHTNGLCAAPSAPITILSTAPLVRNEAWYRWLTVVQRAQGVGLTTLWLQPFIQSGLSRSEPCVARKTQWTSGWILLSSSSISSSFSSAAAAAAVGQSQGCRYKSSLSLQRRFLLWRFTQADAQRSRGDPTQLQPHRDPSVCASLRLFHSALRGGNLSCIARIWGHRTAEESSFICCSWISWRASLISQAVICSSSRDACFRDSWMVSIGSNFSQDPSVWTQPPREEKGSNTPSCLTWLDVSLSR